MTFSNIYGTASFWTKIFITLCIMLIMLIISAILIWLFSTGFSNILSQSDILVGSMSIQCIFLFISTAVVTAGLFSSRPFSYLKMDKKPTVTALIGVIICMIIFVPLGTGYPGPDRHPTTPADCHCPRNFRLLKRGCVIKKPQPS
jgi:hypothetical protein